MNKLTKTCYYTGKQVKCPKCGKDCPQATDGKQIWENCFTCEPIKDEHSERTLAGQCATISLIEELIKAPGIRERMLLAISEFHSGNQEEGESIVDAALAVVLEALVSEGVVETATEVYYMSVNNVSWDGYFTKHFPEAAEVWRNRMKAALTTAANALKGEA